MTTSSVACSYTTSRDATELDDRTAREAFTIDSYTRACSWAREQISLSLRHPSLNEPASAVEASLKHLQARIDMCLLHKRNFMQWANLSLETLEELSHDAAADMLKRIKERLDEISTQVPSLNEAFQELCSNVTRLQSLREQFIAAASPPKIPSIAVKGRFWLRKKLSDLRIGRRSKQDV